MNEETMDVMDQEELRSAQEERRLEIQRAFDPNRAKVVRKELFAGLRDPAVTIRNGYITFNTACINGMEGVVYVKLLVDEELGFLAVTGCDENEKNALRWCVAKPDKRKTRNMRCPDFTDLIYQLMGWDKKCRYKALGYQINYADEVYYVFDLNVKKVFNEKPKKGEEPVDENGEPIQVDTRTGYYPEDIANTFGVPMEQYKAETAITEMDGFVSIAMLTGNRKPGDQAEEPPTEKPTPEPQGEDVGQQQSLDW